MLLQYYGHSLFTLTTERGETLATDPYGDLYQYPKRRLRAQLCTVSHHHFDHDDLGAFESKPLVLDTPGAYTSPQGVKLTGVPTWHDHHQGAHRGPNLVFVLEAEGLRVVHCGDLGHVPTREQARAIGKPDVLLLPVGGNYTINGQEALETVRLLKPRVFIPMHYRTAYNPEMAVEPLSSFLALTEGPAPAPAALLRLTAQDISQREGLMVMEILPG